MTPSRTSSIIGRLSLLLLTCLSVVPLRAQYDIYVSVGQAGTLEQALSEISEDARYGTTSMKVIGSLNGTDMMFLRDMCGVRDLDTPTAGQLRLLDLSESTIEQSSDIYLSILGTPHTTTAQHFGSGFLYNCPMLEELILPIDIVTIDTMALAGCRHLRYVEIPAMVHTIGYAAFVGCDSLTSLEVPHSVTTIEEGAFQQMASLEELIIGNGVTTIDNSLVLGDNKLKSINLGDAFQTFNPVVFYTAPSLSDINISTGNPYYFSLDGVVFSEGGDTLVCYPPASELTDYVIPDSVTYLAPYSFCQASQLKSISFPLTVEHIDSLAFFGCRSLADVTLNEGLQHLSFGAFGMNLGTEGMLKSITLPSTVSRVDGGAFLFNRSLTTVSVEASNPYLTTDADGLLYDNEKATLLHVPCLAQPEDLPSSLRAIAPYAFAGNEAIPRIYLPDPVQSVGDGAFAFSKAFQITLGKGITSLGGRLTEGCHQLGELYLFTNSLSEEHTDASAFLDEEGGTSEHCTLFVLPGQTSVYMEKKGFVNSDTHQSYFAQIREMEALDHIADPTLGTKPVGEVGIGGRRVLPTERGIHIVTMPGGQSLKRFVHPAP